MMIWEKNSNQSNMAGGVERGGGLEVVREMVNEYPRRGLPGR